MSGEGTAESSPEHQVQFLRFLKEEIWSQIPVEEWGKPPMAKAEVEELLGYGPNGV